MLTNVYRLLCLKSTTPEELYARKINLEHYGEALDLAKRFGLNTDLVFQQQWKNKRVSKITIHDYLVNFYLFIFFRFKKQSLIRSETSEIII